MYLSKSQLVKAIDFFVKQGALNDGSAQVNSMRRLAAGMNKKEIGLLKQVDMKRAELRQSEERLEQYRQNRTKPWYE